MKTKHNVSEARPGSEEELRLENYLPHFQPIIKLSSGDIVGYEALARQRDQAGNIVSAGGLFFNPQVSKSSKLSVDRSLREEAIEHFALRPGSGFLSLNISPDWVDLLSDDMTSPTVKMIERLGLDPSRVVIEITERNGNLHNLKRLTREYHKAGFKVAVDDFGTGASQVDRLIALQPDYIKLDRALFRAASLGGPEADVVLAIATIASRNGCKVICEGIETPEEFHFAIECGADYLQGWLFQAAEGQLKPADTYQHMVRSLKQSYLLRKSQRHLTLAKHNRCVAEEVERLSMLLGFNLDLTGLMDAEDCGRMHQLGVLRYYICDPTGWQVSPNYEVGAEKVSADASLSGKNLNHRPYFPLLHAMHQLDTQHIVVSEPYKDSVSDATCKTFGVFLSAEQVLLVDVLTSESVLFLSNP
ncbi:EAL domain-containing protein [Maricurvus nonylphenolicus]|uniref:EAL domain-containing protein n=1 Tax=Maricurvus nonylphenolicus TaxID=1008307 RepID=UPI0036F3BB2C